MNYRNSNESDTVQKILAIIPLLMIIGGIAVFLVTIGFKIYDSVFISNAVSVSARCTRIWTTVSTDDDGTDTTYHYHADAEYEYQGKSYTIENIDVTEYASVGSMVTVYVHPDNPKNARRPMTTTALVTGIVIAIALEAIGIVIFKKLSGGGLKAPVSFQDSLI